LDILSNTVSLLVIRMSLRFSRRILCLGISRAY
jgi:hypothetical protein